MNKHLKRLTTVASAITLASLTACGGSTGDDDQAQGPDTPSKPNILFVIMDDVGIDQMASFGYGGSTPPEMPNITAVADAGLRFRNTWGMPVCSPGRAAMFTGRYPLRTGLNQAIGPDDLANSQLSPYEVTIPQLLKTAGYESTLIGKFHLAGPDNNQSGNATPQTLGWEHFYGWIGLPDAIDTTAGNVADEDTSYSCGFVTENVSGACYYSDDTCKPIHVSGPKQDLPGLQCLDSGGIFVPRQTCQASADSLNLDFNKENAYYVSPLVIVEGEYVETVPLTDPRARGYRTRIEADKAIEWINERKGSDKPWMATVAFTSAHTPLQTPPSSLLPEAALGLTDKLDCASPLDGRVLQNRMTEALDKEFGRIMVETGLATKNGDGSLNYNPEATNTVVIVVADNGTLGYSVKQPFDGERAKGSAYQTGVWVPLVIAGPQVDQPGRNVEHMVNQVDLFQLFGELAGIDVHEAVPRVVDSAPMLAYLENAEQESIRSINFSMNSYGEQANGARYGPCVIGGVAGGSCTQIPMSKSVCGDNQGVWWGPGYDPDEEDIIDNGGKGYASCGEVNQALYKEGKPMLPIQPETNKAIRNQHYKLVQLTVEDYDPDSDTISTKDIQEFYEINQAVPVPMLDKLGENLIEPGMPPLSGEAKQAYDELSASMQAILASQPECPGDGNQDGKVDETDMENWRTIAQTWGKSSVYDFAINGVHDGLTNELDAQIIQQNMGKTCPKSYGVY